MRLSPLFPLPPSRPPPPPTFHMVQASVVQRAQVHVELLATLHGRGTALYRRADASEPSGASSLQKLVELWDYEGSLGLEVCGCG